MKRKEKRQYFTEGWDKKKKVRLKLFLKHETLLKIWGRYAIIPLYCAAKIQKDSKTLQRRPSFSKGAFHSGNITGTKNPSHMFFCELYEIFVISNFSKVSKYNDITMIFIALTPNLGAGGGGGVILPLPCCFSLNNS